MAHGRRRFTKALCVRRLRKSRKWKRDKLKWRSAANDKPEMSRYLPKNTKTGDFSTQRTLSGSFFVIPERLASIRAVVLAFTANKQTNTLNYWGEPERAPHVRVVQRVRLYIYIYIGWDESTR